MKSSGNRVALAHFTLRISSHIPQRERGKMFLHYSDFALDPLRWVRIQRFSIVAFIESI